MIGIVFEVSKMSLVVSKPHLMLLQQVFLCGKKCVFVALSCAPRSASSWNENKISLMLPTWERMWACCEFVEIVLFVLGGLTFWVIFRPNWARIYAVWSHVKTSSQNEYEYRPRVNLDYMNINTDQESILDCMTPAYKECLGNNA